MDETITETFACHFNERSFFRELGILSLCFGAGIPLIVCLIAHAFKSLTLFVTLYMAIIYTVAVMFSRTTFRNTNIYITADNMLIYKMKWRRKVVYPIDKIERIRRIDTPDERVRSHSTYPLAYGRGGETFLPANGILIWLDRKWIKSFAPIFLNPADRDALISAILMRNQAIIVE